MVIFFIQILLNKEKNNYSRTKTIKKTPENHLENIDGEVKLLKILKK